MATANNRKLEFIGSALMVALIVCGAVVLTPPDASACRMKQVDVFEQSQEAHRVAVGEVTESGIDVGRVLKGSKVDEMKIEGWPPEGRHTNCVLDPEAGTRVLVFVDEKPDFLYMRQSVMPVGDEMQPPHSVTEAFVDQLEEYMDADDPTDRRDVLFGMLTNEQGEIVEHVFSRVYAHPEWWGDLEKSHLDAINDALTKEEYPPQEPFWLLIRLQHRGVVQPLMEQAEGPWSHLGAEGLRVLLNRPFPDIQKHQANGTTDEVIADLKEWLDEHPDDWFASGYKRRGLPVPKTVDELADRIAKGPKKVDRLVAIAACERKTETRLVNDSVYTDGVDSDDEWSRVSAMCRAAGGTTD